MSKKRKQGGKRESLTTEEYKESTLHLAKSQAASHNIKEIRHIQSDQNCLKCKPPAIVFMKHIDFARRFISEHGNPRSILSVGASDDLRNLSKHFYSCQCIAIDAVDSRIAISNLPSINGNHNIYTLNEIVSEKTGYARFWRPRNPQILHIASLVSNASTLSEADAPPARCKSLADVLSQNSLIIESPCLALLTIQGHGTSVLKGSASLLDKFVVILVDVVHNPEISQTRMEDSIAFFQHHGYQLYSVEPVVHGAGLVPARHRMIFSLLIKS